ncbi:hypothetical protein MTR67_040866 [Solanum verrucosum]|uniref:Major facilitator superfamily (MFS) profile domain-containing protein n=1 Tax=Solanum verrucosum TaxID=315347 RepID=A0AAF0UL43_SOLVR|nr:hypothetical protein MTR67_040866 [Solanum verrucosum]
MKVLNALDSAKTQWYHFTAIIIAGMGFFTDAYDLFCISLVTKLLGRIYYHVDGSSKPGSLPPNVSAAIFWLGFGIGGDYPLSATIMSEYANKNTRGAFIAAVFAMQGFGILGGGIFAIIISAVFQACFKAPTYQVDPLGSTVPQADYVWRIILMAGSLPALLTYYWRMKMPETARYTALVAKNVKQATADMENVMQVDIGTDQKEPAVKSGNEFGLFTQNLFQKDIFSAIGWIPAAKTMNAIEEVQKIARAQTLIALCSTVPGYWFTVFLIDRIGRFTIQLIGFTMMTVFMFALAIPYHHWTLPGHHIGFVVLYSLTFFFANFGPNATTFVVPAEIFPARLRSTCHGISAACGKLGAMVGAFGFLYLAQPQDKTKADAGYPAGIGVRNSLIVLGVVNLLGLFFTFLVPESKGKSLEEMSRENEDSTEEGAEVENHSSDNRTVPV